MFAVFDQSRPADRLQVFNNWVSVEKVSFRHENREIIEQTGTDTNKQKKKGLHHAIPGGW